MVYGGSGEFSLLTELFAFYRDFFHDHQDLCVFFVFLSVHMSDARNPISYLFTLSTL